MAPPPNCLSNYSLVSNKETVPLLFYKPWHRLLKQTLVFVMMRKQKPLKTQPKSLIVMNYSLHSTIKNSYMVVLYLCSIYVSMYLKWVVLKSVIED